MSCCGLLFFVGVIRVVVEVESVFWKGLVRILRGWVWGGEEEDEEEEGNVKEGVEERTRVEIG